MFPPGIPIIVDGDVTPKIGRPTINGHVMSPLERKQRQRKRDNSEREKNIAILDFETDPFDNDNPEAKIAPFLGVIYSDNFDPIVIWEEDSERFVLKIVNAIESLPDAYTIYAHNGGKFDYMFFIKYIRGRVSFKGRGIMACKLGKHELRDSFHILPEKLANWKKDSFDYSKMARKCRTRHKEEIVNYCINDCKYLLEFVKKFVAECGLKISIGQAAMYFMRKHYKVKNLGELSDAYLRQWYYGGRVECLQGRGHFRGDYKLYDVNSMYPYVMAYFQHPVGNTFLRRYGEPNQNTVFLELECDNYGGALFGRLESGELSGNIQRTKFRTTIWEYNIARKYNLISRVKIWACLDFEERSTFENFVLPMYSKRQSVKEHKSTLIEDSAEWLEAHKDDLLLKYLLNNAYGKYAQNPRRFKETFITDSGCCPEYEQTGEAQKLDGDLKDWIDSWGDLPVYRGNGYDIWERPSPGNHFYNVATAASITGAARSILLEAIHNSSDPIYCDTDSLICHSLNHSNIDRSALGAWKLEREFSEVLIAGKKLYATRDKDTGKERIKSKGASGLTWQSIQDIIDDQIVEVLNRAPTMTKRGDQYYIKRRIRATTPIRGNNIYVNRNEIGKRLRA